MATFVEWDVGVKNPQKRFVEGTWVEVATPCAKCQRLSLLYYYFWLSELDDKYLRKFVDDLHGENSITRKCDEQHPPLTRKLPAGSPSKLFSAWKEAEIAFSTDQLPTVSTIAYRRVLESAAKLFAGADGSDKTPLGARLKKLNSEGIISDDLLQLTSRALSFGNAAAHEDTPLTKADAAVARDLAEAFLRHAYTVPRLLKDAEKALQKRSESEKKLPDSTATDDIED